MPIKCIIATSNTLSNNFNITVISSIFLIYNINRLRDPVKSNRNLISINRLIIIVKRLLFILLQL